MKTTLAVFSIALTCFAGDSGEIQFVPDTASPWQAPRTATTNGISGPSLDVLIPLKQQMSMGLNKLSADEKEALREHIVALLTAAGVAAAPAVTSQTLTNAQRIESNSPLLTAIENSRAKARRLSTRGGSSGAYFTPSSGHWVDNNIGDGEFIRLEDGTLWKIDPLDKIDASLWLHTSSITVIDSEDGSPGYDYLLINTDDNEKAHAKIVGRE